MDTSISTQVGPTDAPELAPAVPPAVAPPDQAPLNVLAIMAGNKADSIASFLIKKPNWKSVLAFCQPTNLSNEWISSVRGNNDVQLVSWQDGAPYYYYWLVGRSLQVEVWHSRNGSTAHSESSLLAFISCAAGTWANEENLLQRTRALLTDGPDLVLDFSLSATFANEEERIRFDSLRPRIQLRHRVLIKAVRLASQWELRFIVLALRCTHEAHICTRMRRAACSCNRMCRTAWTCARFLHNKGASQPTGVNWTDSAPYICLVVVFLLSFDERIDCNR